VGISGWKNFTALLRGTRNPLARREAWSILGVQVVLWGASFALTERWWIYPVLWWLPWMTQWRVLNRLRAIAEHGGLEASKDRRVTTHNVRQSPLARAWLVPYNTGWHLAHHVDMGIPWRNLPPSTPSSSGPLRHRGAHLPELPGPVALARLCLSSNAPHLLSARNPGRHRRAHRRSFGGVPLAMTAPK